MATDESARFREWIDRIHQGDNEALNELMTCFASRLMHLSRRMLKTFPAVMRWEQTGDLFGNMFLRLRTALQSTRPETPAEFIGLAARHIRFELLDMIKDAGRRPRPSHGGECDVSRNIHDAAVVSDTGRPDLLAVWTEFHKQAGELKPALREVFDLMWYHGMSKSEAAELLDHDERTIARRWIEARIKLSSVLGDRLILE
jgi:RNA polymerase sigma-70 factor (ECF subfamily)